MGQPIHACIHVYMYMIITWDLISLGQKMGKLRAFLTCRLYETVMAEGQIPIPVPKYCPQRERNKTLQLLIHMNNNETGNKGYRSLVVDAVN